MDGFSGMTLKGRFDVPFRKTGLLGEIAFFSSSCPGLTLIEKSFAAAK